MKGEQRRSISQLDFERRALKARLTFAGKDGAHAERLIHQIEDCDLMIAAAPAESLADLAIKFELLLEALAFGPDVAATSLEGVLLLALRKDLERLASPRA